MFITVGSLLFTMGLLVLVIDVAWMYFHRTKLQSTVDAAWKAGFDELSCQMAQTYEPLSDAQKDRIVVRIKDLFRENGYDGSTTRIITNFRGPATWTQALEVSAFVTIDLYFGKALDLPIAAVYAGRGLKDANEPRENVEFAIPIGLPHGKFTSQAGQGLKFEAFKPGEGFLPGKEYLLRPGDTSALTDATGRSTSLLNHGSLAFEPAGSPRTYEKCLQYGFPRPLTLFETVEFEKEMQDAAIPAFKAMRLANKALMGRCIFPIVAQPAENQATISSKLIYELSPGNEKALITGFGVFDLIPDFSTASQGCSLTPLGQGALAGTFVHYVINPFDVQPLETGSTASASVH